MRPMRIMVVVVTYHAVIKWYLYSLRWWLLSYQLHPQLSLRVLFCCSCSCHYSCHYYFPLLTIRGPTLFLVSRPPAETCWNSFATQTVARHHCHLWFVLSCHRRKWGISGSTLLISDNLNNQSINRWIDVLCCVVLCCAQILCYEKNVRALRSTLLL